MTGNATIIELPQVGESVTEGTIVQWLKGVGDHVDRYDPLVEVLTDKVSMEVPSPVAGVITELLAEEGQTLPMGAPIASIQTEDAVESPAPNRITPAAPTEEPQSIDRTGVLLKDVAPVGPTGAGNVIIPAAQDATASEQAGRGRQRRRYSPAVQRLADEHGIDLSQVQGTGISGRITRKDVLAYTEARAQSTVLEAPAASAPTVSAVSVSADEERLPLSPVRRLIAANMKRSASEIPAAWSITEVDVSGLVRRREALRGRLPAARGRQPHIPALRNKGCGRVAAGESAAQFVLGR